MLLALKGSGFNVTLIIMYLAAVLFNIFVSLPFHECAHGLIAYKLGDNTAKYQKRLSLNPFRHIDWFGALSMVLFGFGWAKPVPVNPNNFKNRKVGMAITAAAGPLSNILLAFILAFISNIFFVNFYQFAGIEAIDMSGAKMAEIAFYVGSAFQYAALINVSLAVFNLIPIPPLDGSRIATMFLSDKAYYTLMRLERYTMLIIWGIVYILGDQINFITDTIMSFINTVVSLPFGF